MAAPPHRDTRGLRPRKEPQQSRSRDLVAAIEEAATRIVRDEGVDALTVESVCRVAGVSPGSFYQYFPHQEAVLYQLLRRHAEAVTTTMAAVLTDHATSPVPVLVHHAVHAFLDVHRADPRLHAALGHVVAARAGPGLEDDLLATSTAVLGQLLAARSDELGDRPPEVVAFLLVRGLEGVVHAATRDAPALLDDPAFAAGLERMLVAVVAGEDARPGG